MVSALLLGIVLAIFLVVISIIFHTFKSTESETSPNLPPGKHGWPIIGETFEYMSCPETFVRDRMQKYSTDVFKTSIAGEKIAILCGPLAKKFISSKESDLFRQWLPRSVLVALSLANIEIGLTTWKLVDEQIHKVLKLESILNYIPIMDVKAREHLETHWAPYDQVKVQLLSKEFTFAIACCLFINVNSPEKVRELAEPFFLLTKGVVSVPLNFPGTSYNRACKAAKVINQKITKIIQQRKVELFEGGDYAESQDLLTQVLQASHGDTQPPVDDEEIAGKIAGLIFGGFNSLSNAIMFSLGHLAEYPDVYETVLQEQLEISRTKERGELLTWKDIQQMRYLWNVVCESMRLQPPAIGSFREVLTDFTYAGFRIPKGWKVHWTVLSTNKDPKFFPNPEKFDPSRFEDNGVPPFAYVPFGGGPRMCTGKEYARIVILVFLHNVVTKFRLKKGSVNEKILYNPDPVPADGLPIRLERHGK